LNHTFQTLTPPPARKFAPVTYRWRQEYGGLKSDQVKRLKELETENVRLRKAVSDLTLEKLILKEAASGNW
jgi:putative transposase